MCIRDSDQLHIRGGAQQLGNDVAGSGQQASLQENDVGGKSLNGRAQILQRIGLSHDAQIVFQRKYLANPDSIDRSCLGKLRCV